MKTETKLNRHKRPYISPDQHKRQCRVKNSQGLIYKPTQAPAGICKCGVMLELKPGTQDYIFPTVTRANHAISHTLKFLGSIGVEENLDFVIERL